MWKAVATSADDRAMASAELAQVMEDQRRLIGQSPDWVYKINLLRMISFDCALRGRACQPTGSVITEAVSRRDALTLDERAALAGVLISEGDRIAPADGPRAQALWPEASQLLSADFRSTWSLIQQTRAERRLRQRSHLSGIPPKAFAGTSRKVPAGNAFIQRRKEMPTEDTDVGAVTVSVNDQRRSAARPIPSNQT